jgi:ATP-dependent RNA helicase DeaD
MSQPPKKNFDDFYLSDDILQALANIGYEAPTEVQREAIPLILAGIDLIVQSQTGTGKTAACAIPIAEMLEPNPGEHEVLVLTPTRELARQVYREFERIGSVKDLNATAIYGGTSYEKQFEELETAQIIVATPGRLLDLLERGKVDVERLRFFGLDEADEMMSMGFREELEAIVEFLPDDRQTLLFSATVDEAIKSLANDILFYPEYISLSSDSVAAESVSHIFYRSEGSRRKRDLVQVIEAEVTDDALIFANTRDQTFAITNFLQKYGYNAEVLNGELPQSEREETLAKLREGNIDYLVATDVAARGIDISDLGHVINFEMPQDPEVYVHRTGRTGRIGKQGEALSLVSKGDMASFLEIRRTYDIDFVERTLPTIEAILENKERQNLRDLAVEMKTFDHLPYGAKLGMAEQLLAGNVDERVDAESLVARLIALADRVFEESNVRDWIDRLPAALAEGEPAEAPPEPPEREPTRSRSPDEPAGEPEPPKRERGETAEQTDEAPSEEPAREPEPEPVEPDEETFVDEEPVEPVEEPELEEEFVQPDAEPDYPRSKMYMDVGRDYFDDSDDLRETLCHLSGMSEEDFGNIVLKSRYSFVEVREDYFYDVINALNNQEYDDTTLTAEPARS